MVIMVLVKGPVQSQRTGIPNRRLWSGGILMISKSVIPTLIHHLAPHQKRQFMPAFQVQLLVKSPPEVFSRST